MFIYIYRERERHVYIYICIYMYIYTTENNQNGRDGHPKAHVGTHPRAAERSGLLSEGQ